MRVQSFFSGNAIDRNYSFKESSWREEEGTMYESESRLYRKAEL